MAALVRYVILAKMLGPQELGLAATLILTSQFFESVSDTGANRFIVQDARGDTREMQGLVHLALATRGVLIAVGLALTAGLVADLYNAPVLAPALIALGLAPFINGFLNLDLKRLQRTGDFRPEAICTILSELTLVATTGIAAWIVRDYTAVIYGLVARALVMVIASHVVAKRRYGWAFGRTDAATFSRFAAPLFLNGLFLFFGAQGDRVIVGSVISTEALGHYSAVLLLIYYPAAMISRFLMGINMPQIANSRDDPSAFAHRRSQLAARVLLLSAAMMTGFCLVGPFFVPLLYGERFIQPLPLFALLAALQGVRLLRAWPTIIALGTGDSVTVMINNIIRILALPMALGAYQIWPSIYAILAAFIFGEILAMLTAVVLLTRRKAMEAPPELRRIGIFVLICGALVACTFSLEGDAMPLFVASLGGLAALLVLLAWTERSTVAESLRLVQKRAARFIR